MVLYLHSYIHHPAVDLKHIFTFFFILLGALEVNHRSLGSVTGRNNTYT
jgi:hypothetical protein